MLSVKRAFRAALVRAGPDPNMQDAETCCVMAPRCICAVFGELPDTSSECVGMTVAFNACYDRLEIPNDIK